MTVSLIISTYNSPKALDLCLMSVLQQSVLPDEVLIADDGSNEETRKIVEEFKKQSTVPVIHVWHEDRGFQKSEILNKATKASQGDYLIFSDGDCIPRQDFVATHISNAKPGFFLSGGYFMLPAETSSAITKEDMYSDNNEKLVFPFVK